MRTGVAFALVLALCGCGSSTPQVAPSPKVANFALNSKLMGRQMYGVLVTPAGGGKGRPLLVFLHGYGAAPRDMFTGAFAAALRRLGNRAPVVVLPEGDVGWWHDRAGEPWGRYVLHEVIPAAVARSGADPKRVAIGGVSMGGFGALDLGRIAPQRFCAIGAHSPAIFSSDPGFDSFDGPADFRRNDLLRIARGHSPYRAPVWIDIGNRDELRPGAAALARELRADGAHLSFHVWPGEHTIRYWNAHFADYLRFYADACG
ncbi:MAG TPA: alpha/beta hydrolase-fold protein [Gaiellaceae bacterium]|nr:alpha/beta hydrolase-fold protein [Gaiellaceae bacterium]